MMTQEIKEFAKAFAMAQAKFKPVNKTKEVIVQGKDGKPGYKYKFAPLDEVINATRDALSSNGISITQFVTRQNSEITVSTILLHSSGEYLNSEFSLPPGGYGRNAAQDVGGTITYARRYALSSMLGIASEDDDDMDHDDEKPRGGDHQSSKPRITPKQTNPQEATQKAPKEEQAPVTDAQAFADAWKVKGGELAKIVGPRDSPESWTDEMKDKLELRTLMQESRDTQNIELLDLALVRAKFCAKVPREEFDGAADYLMGLGRDMAVLEEALEMQK